MLQHFIRISLFTATSLAAAIPSDKRDEDTPDAVPPAPTPSPPPPRQPPIERHPSNDDWGTTYIAIVVMTLIAFAALGLLVKRSFLLVPTGVMALRTLVGGRSADNYHVLVNEDSDSDELAAEEHEEVDVDEHGGQEDARVLHIVREQTAPEDEGHTDEQGTRRS